MTKMTKTTTSKLLTCLVAFGCLLVVSGCNKGLKERATKAEKESAEAKAELKSVQKELKEAKLGSADMVMDLEKAKTDLENAVKAGDKLKAQALAAKTECDNLKGQCKIADDEANRLKGRITALTAGKMKDKKRMRFLLEQIKRLDAQIAQLKSAARAATTQPTK